MLRKELSGQYSASAVNGVGCRIGHPRQYKDVPYWWDLTRKTMLILLK